MEQKRSSIKTQTIEELEKVVLQTFQQIINEEITQWREKNRVDNACAPVCEKVLHNFRMLEKKIVKDLLGCSKRPLKDIRSAQVPVDENDDQNHSRTCTGNAKREDAWFLSTMGSAQDPVITNETYIRPDNVSEGDSRQQTKELNTMLGVQVPVTANEQNGNHGINSEEKDTTLLITDSATPRSAHIIGTNKELEMKEEEEEFQVFTNGNCLLIFQTVFEFLLVFK